NLPSLKTNAEARRAGVVPFKTYTTYFSNDLNYQLVEDNPSFALYENKRFLPLIRTENATFQKISDTTYHVHLTRLDGGRDLTFLRRFDDGWQLYPQRVDPHRQCQRVATFDGGLAECAKGSGGLDVKGGMRAVGAGT